jgi:hypothetical protein
LFARYAAYLGLDDFVRADIWRARYIAYVQQKYDAVLAPAYRRELQTKMRDADVLYRQAFRHVYPRARADVYRSVIDYAPLPLLEAETKAVLSRQPLRLPAARPSFWTRPGRGSSSPAMTRHAIALHCHGDRRAGAGFGARVKTGGIIPPSGTYSPSARPNAFRPNLSQARLREAFKRPEMKK